MHLNKEIDIFLNKTFEKESYNNIFYILLYLISKFLLAVSLLSFLIIFTVKIFIDFNLFILFVPVFIILICMVLINSLSDRTKLIFCKYE